MVVVGGACSGPGDDESGDGAATSAASSDAAEVATHICFARGGAANAAALAIAAIQESLVGTPTSPYAGIEIAARCGSAAAACG